MGSLERLRLLSVTPSKGGTPSSLVRCFDILSYIYCCLNIPGNLSLFFFALNFDTYQNNVLGRALFLAHSLLEKYTESLCLCGSFQVTFVNFKIFIINMYAIVECFLQFYNEDPVLLFEIQILIRFKAGRRFCKF